MEKMDLLSWFPRWSETNGGSQYLDDVYDGTHWKLKLDFIKSIQKFTGDKDCDKSF